MQNNLYQLIISRLDGEKVSSAPYQEKVFELVRKGIGGFIVFGGEREETKAFINKLQADAEVPLFIASDIERGVGQQIKGCTEFPCQMAVRAAIQRDKPKSVSLLQDVLRAIALEAIDVGINMPLIPVLDVNQKPDNPIVCTRAFSDNPEDVSWFGSAYIKALEGSGLISCAKHFPGHGDTSTDSHIALPTISKSYKDLMAVDVMPFQEGINAGVASIMVGHLQIPALDSKPATVSEKIIKGLLRDKLGFDGMVITDALNMSALSNIDNLPAKCIKAGVDLLLHPTDADATVKELATALKKKELDETNIDSAIIRIQKVKSRLSHIKRVPGGLPSNVSIGGLNQGKTKIDYQRHKQLSTTITDASITLIKGAEMLPITDAQVVLAGADKFHEPSLWKRHFRNVSIISEKSPLGKDANKSPLPSGERDRVRGFSDENTIFAIFSEVSAWKGSSGISDEERQKIQELIKEAKGSIVISFGSPYLLSHFKDADVLIAAYGATKGFQQAVIKGLKGEMEFKGKLPVKL